MGDSLVVVEVKRRGLLILVDKGEAIVDVGESPDLAFPVGMILSILRFCLLLRH